MASTLGIPKSTTPYGAQIPGTAGFLSRFSHASAKATTWPIANAQGLGVTFSLFNIGNVVNCSHEAAQLELHTWVPMTAQSLDCTTAGHAAITSTYVGNMTPGTVTLDCIGGIFLTDRHKGQTGTLTLTHANYTDINSAAMLVDFTATFSVGDLLRYSITFQLLGV